MTEKIFYTDVECREFTALVTGTRTSADGVCWVELDRTAFYPTGGGQPNDIGSLQGVRVADVTSEDGAVWHALDGVTECPWPVGTSVTGVVDWARRRDHTQQHTGQHILSAAFVNCCQAQTVAFHLGPIDSTIDLDPCDLSEGQVAAAEVEANRIIADDLPVLARFVTDEELAALPLRKPPKVTTSIRIVEVAGYDWSACGGTHTTRSAQVGPLKIVKTERRGKELRVTFLCGGRALADYQKLHELRVGMIARFSTGQDDLLGAVDRTQAEVKDLRHAMLGMEAGWAAGVISQGVAAARVFPWGRLVRLELDECPLERAKRVALLAREVPGVLALIAVRGQRPQLLFARADDVPWNMHELIRTAASAAGGRGGGRPEFAQGGAPGEAALAVALATAEATVTQAED
jgi:alanyl-tRNA synthetase